MALLVSSPHPENLKTACRDRIEKILVLSPTATWKERNSPQTLPPNVAVEIRIAGIGPYRSACDNTYHHILRHRRPVVADPGGDRRDVSRKRIVHRARAGAGKGSENAADLPVRSWPEGFQRRSSVERLRMPATCPQEYDILIRPTATALSAASGTPFAERSRRTDSRIWKALRSFYACTTKRNAVPGTARPFPNRVGEPFPDWDIETATDNLARDLNRLIHELEA